MPAANSRAFASMAAKAPGSSSASRVARPAVVASGLPESVPAWYTGPAGATISMMARLPP